MHLSDTRLGLKLAAGFKTLQDLQEEEQQRRQRTHASQRQAHDQAPAGGQQQQQPGRDGQQQSYHCSTESSRGQTNAPILHSASSTAKDRSKASGQSNSSNATCRDRTFQLPLYKLAAFIRTAKLLPRLLEKYISQLQLQGQEQRGSKVDSLPVMPCLQLQVPQAFGTAMSTSHSGQRKRCVAAWLHARSDSLQSLKPGNMSLCCCWTKIFTQRVRCSLPASQAISAEPCRRIPATGAAMRIQQVSCPTQRGVCSFLPGAISHRTALAASAAATASAILARRRRS